MDCELIFFIGPLTVRYTRLLDSSVNHSWYQPIDTVSEPPLNHPYSARPYVGHDAFSTTPAPSSDTLRCFPPASIGLPPEIVPGYTALLGDPGRINPFQNTGFNQQELPSGRSQPNDFNDMVETSFFGGVHVDTEARSTTSTALPSLPVGKPDEADDKTTVADLDRLRGIKHDRVCTCLNCLHFPYFPFRGDFQARFPALQYISCRVEGCTWIAASWRLWDVACHEDDHFREEARDQDGKFIYTCKNDRCHIRTKRKDDVKRHYATVHCKNPERFPCHVIGCPFGGENGFTRKDKLTSHMKSTHKGLPHPGKRLQAIKPKTGVSSTGVHKAGSQA